MEAREFGGQVPAGSRDRVAVGGLGDFVPEVAEAYRRNRYKIISVHGKTFNEFDS